MSNQLVNAQIYNIALEAARASQAGKITFRPSVKKTQEFHLREGGLCLRFVRQVFECALDLPAGSWEYAAAAAKQALRMMEADGKRVGGAGTDVDELKIGDIIGITTGTYGHIAIFMGIIDGVYTVAENTSSGSRGKPTRPGTKLTPYAALQPRVTGIYRLYPSEEKNMKVIVKTENKDVNVACKTVDNSTYVPVRDIARALGYKVEYDPKTDTVTVEK